MKRVASLVITSTVVIGLLACPGAALARVPDQDGRVGTSAVVKQRQEQAAQKAKQTRSSAIPGQAGNQLVSPPRPLQARPQERVVKPTTRRGTTGASLTTAGLSTMAADGTAVQTVAAALASSGGAVGSGTAKTLVLYDTTGAYGWLGETYATQAANLASRFGTWTAHPVSTYTAGELSQYTAMIYIGSTYDEPMSTAFLDDVLNSTKPVVWMYDNIWQLTARHGNFQTAYGFTWKQFDFSTVGEVRYQGTSLTRYSAAASGIMDEVISDTTKATVVADAVRADGTTFPWGVKSGNITYLGEIPFAYVTHDDRYLAFCDLLYTVLAPTTATNHRALVRLEDVGPDSDPTELRAIADYLYSQNVPFSVAVYTEYRDPNGTYNNGVATTLRLRDAPTVVSALSYMVSKGGTLIMHGWTHQYETAINPYTAASGDDFEFFTAHVDSANYVRYDGPVALDSTAWANGRISSATAEFTASSLTVPTIFEFPHYAGSVVDYTAVKNTLAARYDRGIYPAGALSGGTLDYTRLGGQFYPYPVRDIYGSLVVPENLGNVEPEVYNNNPVRLPADILASATRAKVIRNNVASFFYHPFLGTAYLQTIVTGMKGMGYTFTSASNAIAS